MDDHEHAIERHGTELTQHASEVEAHGRALADTSDDTAVAWGQEGGVSCDETNKDP